MMRRPPRSTQSRSSAASDVYKRQLLDRGAEITVIDLNMETVRQLRNAGYAALYGDVLRPGTLVAVSYTHLRAHETVLDLVCRLLLEKKNLLP